MRVLITLAGKINRGLRISIKWLSVETTQLERHGGVHRDEASDRAHAKGNAARQGLSRARAALHELLERGIRREADG